MFCLVFFLLLLLQLWSAEKLKSGLEWTVLQVTKGNQLPSWVCFRSLHKVLCFYSKNVSLLQVYKAINIYVALIGLEIWTDNDKCLLSRTAGFTLDSFSKWRNSDLLKRKRNDNAQLITCVSLFSNCMSKRVKGICSYKNWSPTQQRHCLYRTGFHPFQHPAALILGQKDKCRLSFLAFGFFMENRLAARTWYLTLPTWNTAKPGNDLSHLCLSFSLLWSQNSWASWGLQRSLTAWRATAWSLKAGKCRLPNQTNAHFTILAHIQWPWFIQALCCIYSTSSSTLHPNRCSDLMSCNVI